MSPDSLLQFAQYRAILCGCSRGFRRARQQGQARISRSYSLDPRACVAAHRSRKNKSKSDRVRCVKQLAFFPSKMPHSIKLEILHPTRFLQSHPHLAPPLSTYHVTLLYTQLSLLSNACHKTPPQTRRICRGVKPGVVFGILAAGYSVANPKWEAHSLSSMVLPKPAGAETNVSLRVTPSFSCSVRRGRETKLALSLVLSEVEGPVEGSAQTRGM